MKPQQPPAPQHSGDFLRLENVLSKLRGFHALLVQHNNPAYRDDLIARLQTPDSAVLDLKNTTDYSDFEQCFSELAAKVQQLHLINLESLSAERRQEFYRGINYHREYLARELQGTLLVWLVEPHVHDLALKAPDFWAWREQVLDFTLPPEPLARWQANYQNTINLDKTAKQQRIQEILDYLTSQQNAETSLTLADMQHELGNLHERLGEYNRAQQHLETALAQFSELDERHAYARVLMDKAYLRFRQGEPAEALADLQTKVLPWFVRLNDLQRQVETLSRIADIKEAQGQLDEALHIRETEELPVYEQLGDVREKAVTQGKIANILKVRGQLDEALRIHENEVLPVFEQLGAVHEKAVAMGKIADILQARGQLDEALRIYQNETIPVYEQLGDVREKAVTMGKIADILQARGQLDEALRIYQNEELPVYEQLGDVRDLLVGRTNLALLLWQMDVTTHAARVQELLCLALSEARRLQLPEAGQIEGFLEEMGLSCE